MIGGRNGRVHAQGVPDRRARVTRRSSSNRAPIPPSSDAGRGQLEQPCRGLIATSATRESHRRCGEAGFCVGRDDKNVDPFATPRVANTEHRPVLLGEAAEPDPTARDAQPARHRQPGTDRIRHSIHLTTGAPEHVEQPGKLRLEVPRAGPPGGVDMRLGCHRPAKRHPRGSRSRRRIRHRPYRNTAGRRRRRAGAHPRTTMARVSPRAGAILKSGKAIVRPRSGRATTS